MNRDEFIMNRLNEHYNFAIKQGYEVVCLMLQGSQNYELDVYTDEYKSDIDTKAIVLPKFDEFCKVEQPVSTTLIMENNEHCDVKDIRVMFKTFEKQNINFLEVLFTRYVIINPKYKNLCCELFEMADDVADINYNQALNCIVGMSKQKLCALKHPYPTILDKIEKYGYDPKQLHHILRINDFIKKFVAGKSYRECLVPDNKDYLLKIKTQPLKLEEAEQLAIQVDEETYQIKERFKKETTEIRQDVIDRLQDLSYRFIKQFFIQELTRQEE